MTADPVAPWSPVDPLGNVLGDLRMRGTFYCRAEGSAPWGVEMPALPGCMSFHVVVEGGCRLEVDGAVHELRAGDLDVIAVPYVLKYLVAELAAMGLRMSFAIAP